MAILVTGGAGYIGSHTCVELLNEGYDVIVIDNFANSHFAALERIHMITGKNIKLYTADLTVQHQVEAVFMENEIDAVIHFAGLKAVGDSVKVPLRYYENNVTGTIILCNLMKKYHVKKMVFSSSATVYGAPDTVPIKENSKLKPTNPYGRTKMVIEGILQDLCSSDEEWSISILRYFNPIGAHESGLIGEDPNGIPNNIMPAISQVAVGKLPYLQVFGNQYPTVDGTGVRDYIHVVDLAKGHLKALTQTIKDNGIEAYNLGTGKGFSVLELVFAFQSVSGVEIPYQVVEPRPGDIAICYADPNKAKQNLHWSAERGIREMCEDAWRWQSNNPGGYSIFNELEPLTFLPYVYEK